MNQKMQVELFERASKCARYDDIPDLWNRVLALLELGLCYQPAIAKVLQEGRWRSKRNPKAYVATAAWRQAQAMGLVERRIWRTGSRVETLPGASGRDRDTIHGMDIAEDTGGWDSLVHPALSRHGLQDDDRRPPKWLQREGGSDSYNWNLVARFVAKKPSMWKVLALALRLRFEEGMSRDKAVTFGELHGVDGIDSAWRWMDRNKKRLLSVLQMEKAPVESPKRPIRQQFVPPAEAIMRACAREKEVADLVVSPGIDKQRFSQDGRVYTGYGFSGYGFSGLRRSFPREDRLDDDYE